MNTKKEKLIADIENARARLNESIESKQDYKIIYRNSRELDLLLEQYIAFGF